MTEEIEKHMPYQTRRIYALYIGYPAHMMLAEWTVEFEQDVAKEWSHDDVLGTLIEELGNTMRKSFQDAVIPFFENNLVFSQVFENPGLTEEEADVPKAIKPRSLEEDFG